MTRRFEVSPSSSVENAECRFLSRVEGKMSRVEGKMSWVHLKMWVNCRGFKNVDDFCLTIYFNQFLCLSRKIFSLFSI